VGFPFAGQGVVVHHPQQIAAQQRATMALQALADLDDLAGRRRGVEQVAHLIAAVFGQLQLDVFVQPMTDAGLHQAGIGGIDERAQRLGGQAEAGFAAGIEIEHRPGGFIQTLETQQAQSGRSAERARLIGYRGIGSIGVNTHARVRVLVKTERCPRFIGKDRQIINPFSFPPRQHAGMAVRLPDRARRMQGAALGALILPFSWIFRLI